MNPCRRFKIIKLLNFSQLSKKTAQFNWFCQSRYLCDLVRWTKIHCSFYSVLYLFFQCSLNSPRGCLYIRGQRRSQNTKISKMESFVIIVTNLSVLDVFRDIGYMSQWRRYLIWSMILQLQVVSLFNLSRSWLISSTIYRHTKITTFVGRGN